MLKVLNRGITINQDADFNTGFIVPGPDGLPMDITGYTFQGQMKSATIPSLNPVATFVLTVLNQTTNKGQVSWFLSAASVSTIPTSIANNESFCRLTTPYLYDIYMIDTLGNVTRIIQGIALVSPSATVVV